MDSMRTPGDIGTGLCHYGFLQHNVKNTPGSFCWRARRSHWYGVIYSRGQLFSTQTDIVCRKELCDDLQSVVISRIRRHPVTNDPIIKSHCRSAGQSKCHDQYGPCEYDVSVYQNNYKLMAGLSFWNGPRVPIATISSEPPAENIFNFSHDGFSFFALCLMDSCPQLYVHR